MKKCPKKYIYIKQRNQYQPAITQNNKKMFYLEIFFFFCNNLLDQSKKRLIKSFLYTWLGGRMGTLLGAFSLSAWLIDLQYPKHITLCDTNRVLIIDTVSIYVASWLNFEIVDFSN